MCADCTELREHPLAEHAEALRDRAWREVFEAHPSELSRLRDQPGVLPTGVSAADLVGLVGEAQTGELYAPVAEREAIVAEHALLPGAGDVTARWVPDEVWAALEPVGGIAPRAAVLIDQREGEPHFTHPAQIMGGLRICVAQRALTHAPPQIQGGEQTFGRPRRGCHDRSRAAPRVARIAGRHRRCRWISERSERRLASRSGG